MKGERTPPFKGTLTAALTVGAYDGAAIIVSCILPDQSCQGKFAGVSQF
jgi:hypothetical protein